jgi:EmrB/QacA subfamily drug resistance transporter
VSVEAPPSPGAASGEGQASGSDRRLAWILGVCCVAQFMVILDLSIVNVALPSIQSSLNFSSAGLQWVVDAYAITFAGFLMLGGRVADHFGQRRTFTASLLVFALASLAGGLAPNSGTLVGARAVQGLGCAAMAACSLAIITSSFAPGRQLNRAIGLWAATNGVGGAAGALFGGIITETTSWRWVLLINPPIGIAVALIAYRVVAQRTRSGAQSFDLAGAITLTVGQIVLVYGVVKAGTNGWSAPIALGPILGGIALLALFGVIEARVARAPLVPFKELTKELQNANTIVLLFSGALFPMWYVSSLYLQQVLGLSPLHAGLTFLPMALSIMFVASRAGPLVSRFGVRAVLGGGLTMMTAGMLLFTKIAASGSAIVYVLIPGLLTAAGIALAIVPSTIAATQGAKEGQAGLASGLVNTSRQVGGGLGIAVLITLATQHSSHLIGLGRPVPQALTDGFRLAYEIGAGLCAAAALLAFATLPRAGGAVAVASVRARWRLAAGVVAVIGAFIAVDFADGNSHGAPIGAYVKGDTYGFYSAPGLHPPVARADVLPADLASLAPGYIFLANFYEISSPPIVGQSGPLILDGRLAPVWFRPVPEDVVASNLSLQTYAGKPALGWWQGVITNTGATTSGEDILVDQHYRQVARVRGRDGWIVTPHELIVRGGVAWVSANKNIPMNLSKYGGAYNGALIDSAVQEYDLNSGRLLYTWDALKHIPLSASYATLPINGFPWDAYHVNSIQLTQNGKFVVSMRNTWAAYQVDGASGAIEWTLGGKRSSFRFGPHAAFEWQHDVALEANGVVTMFDDHCCQITGGGTYVSATGSSRALRLKLDLGARLATLYEQFGHGGGFDADYMGSAQPLPGGGMFVGWGAQPYFSEFNASGKLLFDVVLPRPDLSYRTTLQPWVGLPLQAPAGVARTRQGKTTVYASWNGSTQVASWQVLASGSAGPQRVVASGPKLGFETAIAINGAYAAFTVRALDATGKTLAMSARFTASG